MIRSIQIKIVLIFLMLGIAIIGIMGYTNYMNLQVIIGTQVNSIEESTLMIQNYQEQLKLITLYTMLIFTLISVLVGIFVTQRVISPISRLIDNAKKITSGEEIETQELEETKGQSEVDDLVNAFYMMTKELKENLNEVSKQKNQIETILLHMTDRNNCIQYGRKNNFNKSSCNTTFKANTRRR